MNQTQLTAAVECAAALGRVIRDTKEIPSGHLYAQVMGRCSLENYNALIRILTQTGLVEERGDVLRWVAD